MNRTLRTMSLALAAAVSIALIGPAAVRADDDAAPAALAIGSPVPLKDNAMPCVNGRQLSLGAAAGKKGTLVMFICNHCPWVRAWQTRIASIGNAAMSHGVGVVAISSNDPDEIPADSFDNMKLKAKEAGYKFAYAFDGSGDLARAFGATHTPEVFLFDAHGKLVYHGAVDDNSRDAKAVQQHWLADAVTAVQSGKPVVTAETKAMGCGIRAKAKVEAN